MISQFRGAFAPGVVVCVLAGCTNSGVEANFDRASQRTALLGTADLSAPSTLAGVTGQATYEGVALVNLPAGPLQSDYPATADARLVANFDNQTIGGDLTNWEDARPLSYDLRGSAVIFGGAIDPDGTFTANITGNVERSPHGAYDPLDPPTNYVFDGTANGAFHDSTTGEAHSHVIGTINAPLRNGLGVVSGDYVARR